jgi:transposase InsO family protein
MDYHQNARLTVHSREHLARKVLEQGLTLKLAAASFNVSAKTAAKWVRRYQEGGTASLADRSSRPRRCYRPTPSTLIEKVLALRRLRWNGWRIARELRLSRATVSRILRRNGMNRLRSLDPPPPVLRYEHKHPGDMIHFDIKRLARIVKPGHRVHGDRTRETRGAGYEYVHVAIDDHTRLAFAAILPDQTHTSAIRFFHMARAFYSRFGISCRRVLTDNGSCYRHWIFQKTLRLAGLRHHRTKIYRPQTNGKAERFIQTALREWAYARTYQNSTERLEQLDPWLHDYNFHRPHASLNLNPPISRSGLNRNNLLSLHN